jgi:hypothetical protein
LFDALPVLQVSAMQTRHGSAPGVRHVPVIRARAQRIPTPGYRWFSVAGGLVIGCGLLQAVLAPDG